MNLTLLQPVAALALWTFVVWIWLYARRLPYVFRNRVPMDRVATPEGIGDTLPERVNRPSNNFRNLFELPVLFYVLCLAITMAAAVDLAHVILAWHYVGLRIGHSIIHITVNHVPLRFGLYVLSSLVLLAMLLRFTVALAGAGP
jgi:hypothetical protein